MSESDKDGGSKRFQISLTTDRQFSSDAIRAILSTILFHRLFGSLAPTTGEAVGVTYPVASHPETESVISERTKELTRKFRDSSVKTLRVRVRFFSRTVKKSAWFAKTHSFCWESWYVDVTVCPMNSDSTLMGSTIARESSSRSVSSKELQRAMIEVISAMDAYKDHIPPITTTDVAPFPYEITIL